MTSGMHASAETIAQTQEDEYHHLDHHWRSQWDVILKGYEDRAVGIESRVK